MIVHLVEFRIKSGFEAEVVATLQLPGPASAWPAGLVAHCVGRRMGHSHRKHVFACAWQDFESWRHGLDEADSPSCLTRVADRLEDRRDSVVDVLASVGPRWDEGRVLRIYRATVAADSLAEWEAKALGPVGKLSGLDGLVSILVGPAWPRPDGQGDRTVFAISAWRDWSAVLSATGGRIDRLVQRTELADLERPVRVDHYQILDPSAEE